MFLHLNLHKRVTKKIGSNVPFIQKFHCIHILVSSFSHSTVSLSFLLGEVTLIGMLDREATATINLTIMARDSTSPYHSSSTSLLVTLEDVNDNIPTFNQTVYQTSMKEDSVINSEVLKVHAMDRDISINGARNYSILTLGDKFKINPSTGQILTKVLLDHETDPFLMFIVQVCDQGFPLRLCSNTTVLVTVIDINDGTPQFDYSTYRTSLCNDTLLSTVVLHVAATDTDSGQNGEVSYSIIGSLDSFLSFNNQTGQIFLTSEISPSDVGSTINFQVEATDGGDPSLSSTCNVIIDICDRDTDIIKFNQSYYYGDLPENESPGVIIATVVAQSPFGPITYHITPPNQTLPFNISDSVSTEREEKWYRERGEERKGRERERGRKERREGGEREKERRNKRRKEREERKKREKKGKRKREQRIM